MTKTPPAALGVSEHNRWIDSVAASQDNNGIPDSFMTDLPINIGSSSVNLRAQIYVLNGVNAGYLRGTAKGKTQIFNGA